MYVEKMTYKDFDDIERTETFYFNLTEAEIAELELTTEGGLQTRLQSIIDSKNQAEIVRQFKKIVLMAYGEKSDDGRFFMKTPEITARFACTQAYSDLFMKLATDADAASKFVNSIIPPRLREAAQNA